MNELKQKIEQLKALLQEIQEGLQPYLDEQKRTEKHSQLKSVERSIVELQKLNTPVPDELRELKFKLVHEFDQFKEYRTIQRDLSNLLDPFVAKTTRMTTPKIVNKPTESKAAEVKPAGSQRESKKSYHVKLADLLKSGLILPGTEIQSKYNNRWYKAVIQADGTILMNLNGEPKTFNSPSGAAVAASGKSQDGWIFWNLTGSHHAETLDYYRKKYLDHETQGRG
jgi:hypothetical protein